MLSTKWRKCPRVILANGEIELFSVAFQNNLEVKIPLSSSKSETVLIVNNLGNSPFYLASRAYPDTGDVSICGLLDGCTQDNFERFVTYNRMESDSTLLSDAAAVCYAPNIVNPQFKHRLGIFHTLMYVKKSAPKFMYKCGNSYSW